MEICDPLLGIEREGPLLVEERDVEAEKFLKVSS
jgi:hypothetical protein